MNNFLYFTINSFPMKSLFIKVIKRESLLIFLKKILIRVIKIPLNILLIFSVLIPKSNNVWIFWSSEGKTFSDNAKYFFLYVANHHPTIKAIWLSRNKKLVKELQKNGLCAYYLWNLKALYFSFRSNFLIYDTVLDELNYAFKGNYYLQLWHGIPIKKVGYINETELISLVNNSKNIKKLFYKTVIKLLIPYYFKTWKPTWIVSISPIFDELFCSIFDVKKEQIISTGYPRNDSLFSNGKGFDIGVDIKLKSLILKLKNTKNKIVMYMPTWRDTGDLEISKIMDLETLNKKLEDLNAKFVIKIHKLSNIARIFDKNHTKFENVIFCSSRSDIYPILPLIDILITDYSSIFYEFLLLDKPMLFYAYDYKKYITKDRELLVNYKTHMPGDIVTTFDSLLEKMESILKTNIDEFKLKRKKMREQYYPDTRGNYSEKIFHFIRSNFS